MDDRQLDLISIDVHQIYESHLQCEGREFLVEMIREGIHRLGSSENPRNAELTVKGIIYEIFGESQNAQGTQDKTAKQES